MKHILTKIVVGLCSFACVLGASADIITWTGEARDGMWATAANWDLGRVPAPASDSIVLPDAVSPYAVTNSAAATYKIGISVGKNATLCLAVNYATTLFDTGCRVVIKDGGKIDSWHPNGGLTMNFALGSILEMEPGSVFTNRSSYGGTVVMDSGWKLKGGKYTYKRQLQFVDGAVIAGTDVDVGGYSNIRPYDATKGHVLHGRSGSLTFWHKEWTSSRPWTMSEYPGSYINFTPYSTFKLIFTGAKNNAKWVWQNFFSGTMERGRYDNRSLTETEFNELFDVSEHPTLTATVVQLKPQTSDVIVVNEGAVLDAAYDGKAHQTVDLSVAYPLDNYKLEYSLNDSGTWSETVPTMTEAATCTVHVRVTDLDAVRALPTWTKDYTAKLAPRSLVGNATIAQIDEYTATGSPIEPEPVVMDVLNSQQIMLVRDTDYTVSYSDNINPGIATVTVTGMGNYSDAIQTTFRINPNQFDGDVYVDAAAPIGGDGKSWATAIRSVEVAGDMVKAGYTIRIRAGNYALTRPLVIDGKAGVSVVGDGAGTTILSPDSGMTDRLVDVNASPNFVLRGVTVKGAQLTVENGNAQGAGVRLVDSAATIDSCRIDGNRAKTTGTADSGHAYGGGIYASGSELVINNSIVRRNRLLAGAKATSRAFGVGIYSEGAPLTLVDSEVEQNILEGVTGSAYEYGGGICFIGGASADARRTLTLIRTLVVNNSMQNPTEAIWMRLGNGDGIYLGDYAVFSCTDSTIADNGVNDVVYTSSGKAYSCASGVGGNDVTCAMTNTVVCGQEGAAWKFTKSTIVNENVTTTDPGFGSHYACAANGYPSTCTLASGVQRVLYVDPVGGSDAAAGDETHPLKTVAKAVLRAADGEIETIHLGVGTYSTSTNGETLPWKFDGIFGLTLAGAGAQTTILDGEGLDRTTRVIDAVNCGDFTLSGLTVRNMKTTVADSTKGGNFYTCGLIRFMACHASVEDCAFAANGVSVVSDVSSSWLYGFGGVVGCYAGRLAIAGCQFVTNSFSVGDSNTSYHMAYGGAVGLDNASTLAIQDSVFRNCSVTTSKGNGAYGGAIYAPGWATGDNLLLVGNRCERTGTGGAIYSATYGTWSRLTAARNGGAAFCGGGRISDSVFGENAIDISPRGADVPSVSNTLYRIAANMTELGDTVCGDAAFDRNLHPTAAAAVGKGSTLALENEPAGLDLYVDPTVAAGGDGSAAAPFKTLTTALAVVTPHSKIYLAAGNYNGETYPLDLTGLRDVSVVGAAGKASVFDCEGLVLPRFADLSSSEGVRLSNLTIRNVSATQVTAGGAVFRIDANPYVELSDLDIRNCGIVFSSPKDWTDLPSGMILATSGSGLLAQRVTLRDCQLSASIQKSANYLGGGIYCCGGISLLESTIAGMTMDDDLKPYSNSPKGGAAFFDYSAAVVRNCVFSNNTAYATGVGGAGAAICVRAAKSDGGDHFIDNCLFCANGGENETAVATANTTTGSYLTLANNVFYDHWKHLSAPSSYAVVTATHNAATPEAAPSGSDIRITADAALVSLAAGSWSSMFTTSTQPGKRLVRDDANPLLDAGVTRGWMTADSVDFDGSVRLSAHFDRHNPLPDIGPYELLRNCGMSLIVR